MSPAPNRDGGPRRGRPQLVWLVLPLAVVLSLTLGLPVSGSGFSATTQSLTNTWTMASATTDTIFDASDTPANPNFNDTSALNVGIRIRPKVQGEITEIKFYKGTNNTGTHIGKVWSIDGVALATVTFTGETATGWQTMALASPLSVDAYTVYVITVYLPNGHYGYDANYFQTSGRDRTLISTPATGQAGRNAVHNNYGAATAFPTYGGPTGGNYWVDATFQTASHARANAIVQENSGGMTAASTSLTVSLPQGTTSGSQVFVVVVAGATITTPAGWTRDQFTVGTSGSYLFRKTATAGETSWALTLSGSALAAWWAGEISGLQASPYDTGGAQNVAANTATYSTPSITPTSGTRLLLAAWGRANNMSDDFSAITNSFTKIGEAASIVSGSGDQSLAVAWRTVTANGSTSYASASTGGVQHASAMIAAYQ